MKHIRKYNESVTRQSQYKKGEIVIFSDKKLDISFVKEISKILGCEFISTIYNDGFVIKTPIGKEKQSGADFVENYPEFFNGYERRDIQFEYLYDEFDRIIDQIGDVQSDLGSLNEFGKTMLPITWNQSIDDIIKSLQNLKY